MGKKGGAKPKVEVTAEVRKQVDALRNLASSQYLKKEYNGALDAFDKAYKLLPENCAERSDLLQKKAFCYMNLKKYKEAIRETGTILEASPESLTAKKTRIKALEHLGQVKQALTEVQAINREQPSDETREIEKRLKEAVAGRAVQRPASASAASPSAAQRAQSSNASQSFQLTIKATLGNESKLVSTPLTVSYYELLQAVKAKYPDAGPFRLQWTDKDGDNVTITSRQDVQTALGELILAFQKQHGGAHAPRLLQNGLPPLKLQVVPVEQQSQVPKPPLDELFPRKEAGNEPVYEPEEWLLEFARLFSEVTGLDTHTPLEHQNMGADKLQQAMSDTLANEEAGPLFDQAGEHFRDAAVVSLIQWGNVFIVKADRLLQALTKAGKPIKGKELATVMALYDQTQKKWVQGRRRCAIRRRWEKKDACAHTPGCHICSWLRCKACGCGRLCPQPCMVCAEALGVHAAVWPSAVGTHYHARQWGALVGIRCGSSTLAALRSGVAPCGCGGLSLTPVDNSVPPMGVIPPAVAAQRTLLLSAAQTAWCALLAAVLEPGAAGGLAVHPPAHAHAHQQPPSGRHHSSRAAH